MRSMPVTQFSSDVRSFSGDGFQIVKVTRGGLLLGFRVQEKRFDDWRNVGARQPSIEAARALRALLVERRAAVREAETTETVE